jgi:hypothetical protein
MIIFFVVRGELPDELMIAVATGNLVSCWWHFAYVYGSHGWLIFSEVC